MKNILFSILAILMPLSTIYAQGFGYDSKVDIGNGLYKVKNGEYYGIIDKNDNVVVSVEFQDILFRKGKALLTKDDVLYGIVDSSGNVKHLEVQYKVHPKYRYIYDGYIIVGDAKWGFITEDGNPLRMKAKFNGLFSNKKAPTMFDDVVPFVGGFAAVYLNERGWIHIDKSGKERYVLGNKKMKASFRSSVYKGECIIVTEEGIRQYQENDKSQAVVRRIFSSTATGSDFIEGASISRLKYKEGALFFDSWLRVSKFVLGSGTDSIIFIIDTPRKVVVKKKVVRVDTVALTLKDDLKVELVRKHLRANQKGRAYAEVKLINTSNDTFEGLSVTLECVGLTRDWNGSIEGNSVTKLSFNLPARFSSSSIVRKILVRIRYKNETIEHVCPVTIKRYTPVRSR